MLLSVFSEIIAVTESEEEKMEYLEIIQRNSNLLLQLINDILDLSRIESGKSEMHFQQVEIAGLVEEVEKSAPAEDEVECRIESDSSRRRILDFY